MRRAQTAAGQARLPLDLSLEALAARTLARHQDAVRVKKEHLAIKRLALILDATLTLANKGGFHSMSLRDLSEQSGLSMGALYAYFDSKETLLLMILGTVSQVVEEAIGEPPDGLAPAARLRWLLETHLLLTEAMLPWFTFAYMQAKSFPPKARAMAVAAERRTEKLLADVLAEGKADGSFRIDDVEMCAALIKPMLQDWYVKRSKYRQRGVGTGAFLAALLGFVSQAIGADAGQRECAG
ncbi:TetR/AcrR family transcriptional regulator [Xanthobacteraceae bacterium A53D]